jgi:hypothetical protein
MAGCYIKEGDVIEEDLSLISNPAPVSLDSPCGAAIAADVSNTAIPAEVVEGK